MLLCNTLGIDDSRDLEMADVLLAQTWCSTLSALSVKDAAVDLGSSSPAAHTSKPPPVSAAAGCTPVRSTEPQPSHHGMQEYRIREGYSALLAHISRGLQIRTSHRVTRIDYSSADVHAQRLVRVYGVRCAEAARSERGPLVTFELIAKRVILSIPVSLLKQGHIDFFPALPVRHQQAFADFAVHPATKLILMFRRSQLVSCFVLHWNEQSSA